MSKTTITVSIFDDEHGDTTISREIDISPPAVGLSLDARDAVEQRVDQQVGVAHRLDSTAREVAITAAALHLT